MPENHRSGYVKFIKAFIVEPGMKDIWTDIGSAFSQDFSKWIDKQFLALQTNENNLKLTLNLWHTTNIWQIELDNP